MATLPTTLPTTGNARVSDNTYLTIATGATGTQTVALDNMPSDFLSMSAASWTIEYNRLNPGAGTDDTEALAVRITNGSQILAAADSGGTFVTVNSNVTNTTDTTTGPTAFAYVDTAATKADWDAASVEIRQTHSTQMGNDNASIRVDYFALTGDYTPALVVAGNQATETDAANAGSVVSDGGGETVSGGTASESDSSLAGTAHLSVSGSAVNEVDTPIAGSPAISRAGSTATETDTSTSGTSHLLTTGQTAFETDVVNSGPANLAFTGGHASELDVANTGVASGAFNVLGGTASEADVAQSADSSTVAGAVASTADVANSGSIHVLVAGVVATEVDAAHAGSVSAGNPVVQGNTATETDTALSGLAQLPGLPVPYRVLSQYRVLTTFRVISPPYRVLT